MFHICEYMHIFLDNLSHLWDIELGGVNSAISANAEGNKRKEREKKLKVSSRNAVRVFKALSDVTRVEIVRLVGKAPKNVTELTSLVGVSQPKVSRHLKILRDAGLLKDVRRGKWVWYELAAPGESDSAGAVLSIIDSFLSGQGFPRQMPDIQPVTTGTAAGQDAVGTIARPVRGAHPATGVRARRSEPFRKPGRAAARVSAQAELTRPSGADSGKARRVSTRPRRTPQIRAPQRRAQSKDLEDFLL